MRRRWCRPRLRVEPVRVYREPAFPGIETFAEHPEWLLAHAPSRWRESGAALGALTAFVLAASGARADGTAPARPTTSTVDTLGTSGRRPVREHKTSAQSDVSIAPVFIHGEGRGSAGCVAVSPPAFLSELEALEIIWEELREENLGFETRPVRVPGEEPDESREPLYFDAYSPRYRCGVIFVGTDNYYELADPRTELSTAVEYDTLGVAQRVAERLAARHVASAAVFYDPLTSMRRRPTTQEELDGGLRSAKERSRELLRAQVREFVVWVKQSLRDTGALGR